MMWVFTHLQNPLRTTTNNSKQATKNYKSQQTTNRREKTQITAKTTKTKNNSKNQICMKKRKSKGKSKQNREELTVDGRRSRLRWWLGWARRSGTVDGSSEQDGGSSVGDRRRPEIATGAENGGDRPEWGKWVAGNGGM